MRRLSHWSGQQQHLLQQLQALNAQEMQWVQALDKDPDFRCTWCQGTAHPLDGTPQREVQVGSDKMEVVASLWYLGGMLSAASDCELSTTTHVKTTWKKLKEFSPFLPPLFQDTWLHVQLCCAEAMLHASKTWPLTKSNNQCLQQNDRGMIRQICNVKPQDIVTIRSNELLVQLGIEDLYLILKGRRFRWYGHVERSYIYIYIAPMVQSRQPVTYRMMESVGLGGPR